MPCQVPAVPNGSLHTFLEACQLAALDALTASYTCPQRRDIQPDPHQPLKPLDFLQP